MASELKTPSGQNSSGTETEVPAGPPVLRHKVPDQYALELGEEPIASNEDAAAIHIYDLFANPACIATLLILSALLIYYVLDSLPLGESYVGDFPYLLFALAGLSVAGLVLVINLSAKVPGAIAVGLALTGGVVGLLAAHPALLRINAATGAEALQQVEYLRMTQNHFDPLEDDWPAIDMIGKQYWLRVPGEVTRTIPIRRGGLGFYQADLTEIRFELELSQSFARSR